MEIAAVVILGYLLGSIPMGLIAGKLAGGVDVRDYGSGKTGFTNSLRVLGLRRSLPVFLGDYGKGLAATLLPFLWSDDPWARALGGLAAVCGHVWPLFAGFRGGRGVLTGAGVLSGLSPLPVLIVIPIAGATLKLTRYMSITSISAAAFAGVLFVAFAAADLHPWAFAAVALAGSSLTIVLHHDNIRRLLAGTERRVGDRAETLPPQEA
jgi:acyl phosphate:glycerol-3-phosphate acyltransferase